MQRHREQLNMKKINSTFMGLDYCPEKDFTKKFCATSISDKKNDKRGMQKTQPNKLPDYAIIGAPADTRGSYRPGSKFGPAGIRGAQSTDHYNEAFEINTKEWVTGIDLGNIDTFDQETNYFIEIRRVIAKMLKCGVIPITFGGDHSVSYPELLAYSDVLGPVSLIHFDAHTDTWAAGEDSIYYNHSNPFRWAILDSCINPKESIQIGMRGWLAGESDFKFADDAGLDRILAVDYNRMNNAKAAEIIRKKIGNNKVFVSFDVDFVDPAYTPGTGTPVPCGPSSRKALELVRQTLIGLDIVGFDIVEVFPNYDIANITCMYASKIAHEFISLIACKKAGITEYKTQGFNND